MSVALSAIKFGHRIAGQRFDGADPDLVRALAGVRREAVREQRQAAPLRPAVLGDVLASLGDSDLDRRDGAMLATLYMLALRRSELVEIDYEARGDGLAVLRMTDHGLELELLRSKTSQDKPALVAVDRHYNPRAFAALEQWVRHAKIEASTPLFQRINPRGGIGGRITADGVNRAIKAAIARYYRATGADAETAERLGARYSGHSGRVGFVVAAKEAGAAGFRHCRDYQAREPRNDREIWRGCRAAPARTASIAWSRTVTRFLAHPIVTASWYVKLPGSFARVGISRGGPRGQRGFKTYRALAPGAWFKTVGDDEFRNLYMAQLTRLDPEQVLRDVAALADGQPVALLCHEKPPPDARWCHRGLVSAWLKDQLGIDVPEFGHEGCGWGHCKLPPQWRTANSP